MCFPLTSKWIPSASRVHPSSLLSIYAFPYSPFHSFEWRDRQTIVWSHNDEALVWRRIEVYQYSDKYSYWGWHECHSRAMRYLFIVEKGTTWQVFSAADFGTVTLWIGFGLVCFPPPKKKNDRRISILNLPKHKPKKGLHQTTFFFPCGGSWSLESSSGSS